MTRYVIAVSGGVDSVVLLDALYHHKNVGAVDPWHEIEAGEIIVAHFDHGIRPDSADDAVFVAGLAEQYGLSFVTMREELGAEASEDTARRRRYTFLHRTCAENNAQLVTAHHVNDIAETIAINSIRGTGWRGLAVMDTADIHRPFLGATKAEIRDYATRNGLQWHEDSTNTSSKYLRNRLRTKFTDDDVVWQLASLRAAQVDLKRKIERELKVLVGNAPYSRYFFGHCGDVVAAELLRHIFIMESGASPVVAARQRALHAIKVARHGSVIHVADGLQLRLTKRDFVVETTS